MTNYGKTETELLVEDSTQCRQIVKEITKFGVSQPQMLTTKLRSNFPPCGVWVTSG